MPCGPTRPASAIAAKKCREDRKSFRERYLGPALADGLIEMTIPDKPNSRLQEYRLTDEGRRKSIYEENDGR